MASKRVKRKQQQHNGSHTAAYAASFFLLVGLLTAASLALDEQGGLLGFVAKCELYLLGKGSFALPLTCLLLSWKLFVEGKLSLWQKKTLALFLVMLCLLGTAHHVFVPTTQELTPHLLPEGGGLIGGLIVLPLHRYLGSIGSWLALVVGWLLSLGLCLPVGTIWTWLTDLVGAITGSSDKDLEDALTPEPAEPQKTTPNIFKPIVTNKNSNNNRVQGVAPQKSKNKDTIAKAYRSGEFGSFTDGIEKKSSFKRILGVVDNPYEKEPVKQELEQDPIQVPEWQDSGRDYDRERNVVLRPVINYDSADAPTPMPEHRFLDGSAPAPEPAAPPQESQRTRGMKAEPPSVIHNQYREPKQSAPAAEQAQPVKSSVFDMDGA